SPRSEVASRLLMARMPVSGVRTSWAKAASAASTIPGSFDLARDLAGFAALPRLCASFVAGLATRLFVGRLLDDRLLRVGRDRAAMILRPRMEQHDTAKRPESRRGCGVCPRKTTAVPQVGGFSSAWRRPRATPATRSPASIWKASGRPHPGPDDDGGRPAG